MAAVCYYGSLHLTTKILAAVCHRKGQRAFVGKCNMDRNSAPDYQEESVRARFLAVASLLPEGHALINYLRFLSSPG